MTKREELEEILGEVYQLIGAISAVYPDLIEDADKWLDNLCEQKMIHKGLLPFVLGVDIHNG